MRRSLLCGLLLLLAISCATSHQSGTQAGGKGFHRYPACVERVVGGRVLHDTGWVVSEHDAETGTHFFSFLSTYWGRVVEVTRVNRFCNAIRRGLDMGAERPGPAIAAPPSPWR